MIAIIKYNAGNVKSVENALKNLGVESIITNDPKQIEQAEKVIFPGVGEASSAMNYLIERRLDQLISNLKQPVLGICLGMQLMCLNSEEGDTECLGIFESEVKRFPKENLIPQMGWNNFTSTRGNLFSGVDLEDDVYFVHSYYASICQDTVAKSSYGLEFSSALQKNNFYATQFHPEKSSSVGERILKNFLVL